jgi:tRNA threonylcarbamoyladenosine biosynthesis protein TsaE
MPLGNRTRFWYTLGVKDAIYNTSGVEETYAVGREIGARLGVGDCLALLGGLGAGKTAITRGIAEGYGADANNVSSPTYVLCHQYPAGERALFHLDLYRMASADEELEDIGLGDFLQTGAVVIEWANLASATLPHPRWELTIDITGEHTRTMTLKRIE